MISAVILNYLNPQLTLKSVKCLLNAAEKAAVPVEVIVVDNSAPETADELKKMLPKSIKIIENDENVGFSVGNNQGIKQAEREIMLIMNNDLFINKEVLQKGAEYVSSNKKAGIWAPKLVGERGETQRSCASFPTLWGLISEYLFKYPYDNRIALTANSATNPVDVDTVMGACMFIRRDVLKDAGMFDENYFFNAEDVDLCYKIKALGYRVIFDPRVKAVHLYGASQSTDWHEDPYLHKSRKYYHKKHFNAFHAALAGLIIDTGLAARKLKHKLFK